MIGNNLHTQIASRRLPLVLPAKPGRKELERVVLSPASSVSGGSAVGVGLAGCGIIISWGADKFLQRTIRDASSTTPKTALLLR